MQATACYTSVLKFVPSAGRVCGAATHAVGIDAGYGLLLTILNARMRDYFAENGIQSKRLDLSFGIFARRGEKYSCYSWCFSL